jgi:anti-anti-sigma regulatory factor
MILSEAPDLTIIRLVGRLGDDAARRLREKCGKASRPLVLDLSNLTAANTAGVLLLRRLASEGIHLVGMSRELRSLLKIT